MQLAVRGFIHSKFSHRTSYIRRLQPSTFFLPFPNTVHTQFRKNTTTTMTALCKDCVKGGLLQMISYYLLNIYRQVSLTRALLMVCYHLPARILTSDCPIGKWEKIGGVDSYVATPTGEYPQNKAILFLPDVFGPQLINAQVRFP
jgi:hypothetical protein